jgi:hypothetical protein
MITFSANIWVHVYVCVHVCVRARVFCMPMCLCELEDGYIMSKSNLPLDVFLQES